MLETLRKIIQEVNVAKDLKSALGTIVLRIREAMRTEVCSVYLREPGSDRFILMATEGLNKRSIGKVVLNVNEGLVGLVSSREEPVNLPNAADHPSYRYFVGTGEERYAAFLGVPIVHHREVIGVLVVQQRERRQFDATEESFLVTISAQLAAVIAYAEASGIISGFQNQRKSVQETRFTGVAGAPGVAVGTAVVALPPADLDMVPDKRVKEIQAELDLFAEAAQAVKEDIQKLSSKLAKQLRPEELALFDSYRMMLDDPTLVNGVVKVIRDGQWAQGALRQVVNESVVRFEEMDDPYLRERASDIRDIGRRILSYLQESAEEQRDYPQDTILVGEELTASMLGEVPEGRLAGLVSVMGSGNSHVAILARAMGIPAVMGVVDLPYAKVSDITVIVDGFEGDVFVNPSAALHEAYVTQAEEERLLAEELSELRDRPCITPDGCRMPLLVNTGLQTDVARGQQRGAEGVGLYRTEVPFMMSQSFPSEKEQQRIYREQLEAFAPYPVTMRTLDIGGDKSLAYFPIDEDNPFLGWRGIRITLDHPEIFMVQIRAMLKASEGLNNLRILLPMVSSVLEVESSLRLIHRALAEVREEGVEVSLPAIGVMVEVPSILYLVRDIAKDVDFLSVGSNDLTQYLLAVDRNNPYVASLYDHLHPAVLQALKRVVEDCHAEGKPVSICGEMAGDPAVAVLLLGMGFDSLSMNATNLPRVKWVLRQVSRERAVSLLNEVLQMDTPQVIRSVLQLTLRKMGLGKVI